MTTVYLGLFCWRQPSVRHPHNTGDEQNRESMTGFRREEERWMLPDKEKKEMLWCFLKGNGCTVCEKHGMRSSELCAVALVIRQRCAWRPFWIIHYDAQYDVYEWIRKILCAGKKKLSEALFFIFSKMITITFVFKSTKTQTTLLQKTYQIHILGFCCLHYTLA